MSGALLARASGGCASESFRTSVFPAIDISFVLQGFQIRANRSRRCTHSVRQAVIHCSAWLSASGSIAQVRTRPIFSERTSPAASSTLRCCTMEGSDICSGRASSVTGAGPYDRPACRIGEGVKQAADPKNIVSSQHAMDIATAIHKPMLQDRADMRGDQSVEQQGQNEIVGRCPERGRVFP